MPLRMGNASLPMPPNSLSPMAPSYKPCRECVSLAGFVWPPMLDTRGRGSEKLHPDRKRRRPESGQFPAYRWAPPCQRKATILRSVCHQATHPRCVKGICSATRGAARWAMATRNVEFALLPDNGWVRYASRGTLWKTSSSSDPQGSKAIARGPPPRLLLHKVIEPWAHDATRMHLRLPERTLPSCSPA